MGERLLDTQKVVSSILIPPTSKIKPYGAFCFTIEAAVNDLNAINLLVHITSGTNHKYNYYETFFVDCINSPVSTNT